MQKRAPRHAVKFLAHIVPIALVTGFLSVLPLSASTTRTCDEWARVAAAETGVPVDLLRAIAMAESGTAKFGKFAAWPWTVNVGGSGTWFSTREEALMFLDARRRNGTMNFDVGCFQLNYRWHGDRFASLRSMIEPSINARYAAGFLRALFRETGSWDDAAKAYHSRTPDLGNAYLARLRSLRGLPEPVHRAAQTTAEPDKEPVRFAHRAIQGPLIALPGQTIVAGASSMGSLLPGGSGGSGSLFLRTAARQ